MNVNEYLQVCEYVCEYLALNSPQALMQSSHPSNLLTQRRFVIVSPNLLLLFCSPSQEKNHRPSYYLSQRYRNHAQVQVQVNFHFPISTKNSRLLISGHKKISSLTDIDYSNFRCFCFLQSGQFSEDMIPTVGFNMRKVTKGNVTIKVRHLVMLHFSCQDLQRGIFLSVCLFVWGFFYMSICSS